MNDESNSKSLRQVGGARLCIFFEFTMTPLAIKRQPNHKIVVVF